MKKQRKKGMKMETPYLVRFVNPYNRKKAKEFEGTRCPKNYCYGVHSWDDVWSDKIGRFNRYIKRCLKKYVGKPFDEAVKHIVEMTGCSYTIVHDELIYYFKDKNYHLADYMLDDDGNIQVNPERYQRNKNRYGTRKYRDVFTEEQLKWNREHKPKNLDKIKDGNQTYLGEYYYVDIKQYAWGALYDTEVKFGKIIHYHIEDYGYSQFKTLANGYVVMEPDYKTPYDDRKKHTEEVRKRFPLVKVPELEAYSLETRLGL